MQPDGQIGERTRAVVMAAAQGSGTTLQWVSPLKESSGADTPSLDEVSAVIDGVFGLQQCIMGSVTHGGITMQELGVFVRNTPNGTKGVALWDVFRGRRDKPGQKEGYGFPDFIREVVTESRNQSKH